LPAERVAVDTAAAVTAEEVTAILRAHESWLRAAGIGTLSLFGSVARGEARPDSNIDLVAEFNPAATMDLIHLVRLQWELADLLGRGGADAARADQEAAAACRGGARPGPSALDGIGSPTVWKTSSITLRGSRSMKRISIRMA